MSFLNHYKNKWFIQYTKMDIYFQQENKKAVFGYNAKIDYTINSLLSRPKRDQRCIVRKHRVDTRKIHSDFMLERHVIQ